LRKLLAALVIGPALIFTGCAGSPTGPAVLTDLERRTAHLTERLETASFVFHFEPGDSV